MAERSEHAVMNHLIETCRDAERGLRLAAGRVSEPSLKRLLTELASDQDIFYRFTAADLSDINVMSQPITGRFRTGPASRRNIRFAWSGGTRTSSLPWMINTGATILSAKLTGEIAASRAASRSGSPICSRQ